MHSRHARVLVECTIENVAKPFMEACLDEVKPPSSPISIDPKNCHKRQEYRHIRCTKTPPKGNEINW